MLHPLWGRGESSRAFQQFLSQIILTIKRIGLYSATVIFAGSNSNILRWIHHKTAGCRLLLYTSPEPLKVTHSIFALCYGWALELTVSCLSDRCQHFSLHVQNNTGLPMWQQPLQNSLVLYHIYNDNSCGCSFYCASQVNKRWFSFFLSESDMWLGYGVLDNGSMNSESCVHSFLSKTMCVLMEMLILVTV